MRNALRWEGERSENWSNLKCGKCPTLTKGFNGKFQMLWYTAFSNKFSILYSAGMIMNTANEVKLKKEKDGVYMSDEPHWPKICCSIGKFRQSFGIKMIWKHYFSDFPDQSFTGNLNAKKLFFFLHLLCLHFQDVFFLSALTLLGTFVLFKEELQLWTDSRSPVIACTLCPNLETFFCKALGNKLWDLLFLVNSFYFCGPFFTRFSTQGGQFLKR